jgi:hypothetical protein
MKRAAETATNGLRGVRANRTAQDSKTIEVNFVNKLI